MSGLERVFSLNSVQNIERRQLRNRRRQLINNDAALCNRSNCHNSHTLSEKFESLNYEIVENELYRSAELSNEHQVFLLFVF